MCSHCRDVCVALGECAQVGGKQSEPAPVVGNARRLMASVEPDWGVSYSHSSSGGVKQVQKQVEVEVEKAP